MTVRDIYCYIDSIAPFSGAAEWDNSGILVGDPDIVVSKALVCLDVTDKTLEYAKKEGVQLIVSHHPVIFKPQSCFVAGNIAYEAAINGICVICAHTNLDKAKGGVNDTLCEKLGLRYEKLSDMTADGFLNIAYVEDCCSASGFATFIKDRLNSSVAYCDGGRPVNKIAVCTGAGADFIADALRVGCDAFLTGEASYHKFLDAVASGMSLFAAGHFETEIPVVNSLVKKLNEHFNCTVFEACPCENTVIMEK